MQCWLCGVNWFQSDELGAILCESIKKFEALEHK
jgi:hypothetical protein